MKLSKTLLLSLATGLVNASPVKREVSDGTFPPLSSTQW